MRPDATRNDHAVDRLEIVPVLGIGELHPGDDLAAVIVEHAPPLLDGDVLVVTSKAVSKVEGRLITLDTDDPEAREAARQEAIDAETVRVVARRGDLRIVQNRQGLVMAGAGVDASNIARNEIALLPVDPDASAALLREAVRERSGVEVAVIVSDTFGRPWRGGLTDVAIGVAGMAAVSDARGTTDAYGNTLEMTTVAVADELAAAADLVKGKLGGVPVAVVRGLRPVDDGRGSSDLVRDAETDMFRLGTAEAIELGRADVGWQTGTDAPPLHGEAVELITGLMPDDGFERAVREAFLGFLASRPDAVWRSCTAGHLTASALVVDPVSRAVLLTLHPRVGAWLQLGGHCEQTDRPVLDAAAREAREESGLGSLSLDPTPISLDVHPITCSLGVPTRHFDVQFLAVAPTGAQPVISAESDDLQWWPWDALPQNTAPGIERLVRLARVRLGVT